MSIKTLFFALFYAFSITIICAQTQLLFSEEEKKWIEEHPIVHFGYEPNWPPYEVYENEEYSGIVGDYVKLIEKNTGIDMRPIPGITWEESISKLQSKEINVVPIAGITEVRKKFLSFTKPYISDPLVIVTRKDYQFVSDLTFLEGKKVCLPKGYYTVDMIKNDFPKLNVITATSIKQCLLNVSTSKADAFVGSLSVIDYHINAYGFTNLKIASPTQYGYTQMGFAVTKDWEVFRDIVQKIFDNLSKEEHNAIKNKWISVNYDHWVNKRKVVKYVMYIVLFFIVLLLLFYLWNKALKNEINTRKQAQLELRKSLELIQQKNEEKEVLLKEIHHRVKNNLQIVYSLLNMQSREVANENTLMILSEGKTRIKAMALVHQALYQSNNLSKVQMDSYIESLKNNIEGINQSIDKHIEIKISANNIALELDKVIPLGLILNELLTNSFKHAFEGRDSGVIIITLLEKDNGYYFEYKDNGVGIKNTNFSVHKTLGMRLISRLTNQLKSEAIIKNDNGTVLSFSFN